MDNKQLKPKKQCVTLKGKDHNRGVTSIVPKEVWLQDLPFKTFINNPDKKESDCAQEICNYKLI